MPAVDLTQADRDRITNYLSEPMLFPSEFKSWLQDWLAVNIPDIPVSQVMGYKGTLANSEVVLDADEGSGSDRTWQDLAVWGPEIAGLADGTYLCIWGAYMYRFNAVGATHPKTGPSINDADPAISVDTVNMTDGGYTFNWRAAPLNVRGLDNNNYVRLMYWWDNFTGATAGFSHRYMTLIRIT